MPCTVHSTFLFLVLTSIAHKIFIAKKSITIRSSDDASMTIFGGLDCRKNRERRRKKCFRVVHIHFVNTVFVAKRAHITPVQKSSTRKNEQSVYSKRGHPFSYRIRWNEMYISCYSHKNEAILSDFAFCTPIASVIHACERTIQTITMRKKC